MTLSRFLRDYLYIALGGNRYGMARRYANLMITMLLGGLWHGAGWTYLVWGGLHGIYLVINHAWLALAEKIGFPLASFGWKLAATIITFIAVCFSWVFFRAVDLPAAQQIVRGLVGGFGIGIPNAFVTHLGAFKPVLEQAGITFFLGGGTRFVETWSWVILAGGIAFFLPNTQQIMRRFEPALDYTATELRTFFAKLNWHPSRSWAMVLAMLTILCLLSLNKPSDFLYFQF